MYCTNMIKQIKCLSYIFLIQFFSKPYTIEKTAERFLQALDDRDFADAADFSGDSLNAVFSNMATANFALLSEEDREKDTHPPSQETYYAIGCKADTSASNTMICTCKNFKSTEKTALTIVREDPTSAWKVVAIKGRKDIPTVDYSKKEEVAANFIVSLLNRDFTQAKRLALPISAKNIDFIARNSANASIDNWSVSYYDNLSKIKCDLSANGNTANCPYCCNGEGKDDALQLVKIGEKWLVNFE